MIHGTRVWTAALAVTGLMALPISSYAQSSQTSGQSGQSGQDQQQASKSPSYHLDQAKSVLDRIDDSSLTGSTASTVRELKQNFDQLRSAYNSGSSSSSSSAGSMSGTGTSGTGTSGTGTSGTGTSGTTTSGTATSGSSAMSDDWRSSFSKIQQTLDQLNVPKSAAWMPITGTSYGAGSSGTGTSATGTSGTGTSGTTGSGTTGSGTTGTYGGTGSGSISSTSSVDPSVMSDLKEFRRHIEEFYKATSGSDK